MLVLRRTRGQSFVIGKNAEIVVKILNDDNGVISVGIDAPKSIMVDRLEVFEKRQLNKNDSILRESISSC
ncbi:MAG: carbon storage regulator [Gammaproteobacteria bacterium]